MRAAQRGIEELTAWVPIATEYGSGGWTQRR
jgi:hypothetical protein